MDTPNLFINKYYQKIMQDPRWSLFCLLPLAEATYKK